MRVQGRAARLGPAVFRSQEPTQFGALVGEPVIVIVEDLGDGTPAGPAGQDRLLLGISPAASVLTTGVQDGERVEVRSQLGGDARRCQVLLGRRTKRRRANRCVRFGYSGALIVWLISARVR